MSRRCGKTICCPECGQENEIIIWQTLNGDINPEVKQQLLDGTLFRFVCTHCGYESEVDYSILYHDMTHQAMVWYVEEDDVARTQEMMTDAEDKTGEMSGYRMRIVTDQNTLREKAILFEHGLDDRVVEMIKLIYYVHITENYPDDDFTAVYCMPEEDKYILDFFGDRPLSVEVPVCVYDNIKREYAERLDAADGGETQIDIRWASGFIKG